MFGRHQLDSTVGSNNRFARNDMAEVVWHVGGRGGGHYCNGVLPFRRLASFSLYRGFPTAIVGELGGYSRDYSAC